MRKVPSVTCLLLCCIKACPKHSARPTEAATAKRPITPAEGNTARHNHQKPAKRPAPPPRADGPAETPNAPSPRAPAKCTTLHPPRPSGKQPDPSRRKRRGSGAGGTGEGSGGWGSASAWRLLRTDEGAQTSARRLPRVENWSQTTITARTTTNRVWAGGTLLPGYPSTAAVVALSADMLGVSKSSRQAESVSTATGQRVPTPPCVSSVDADSSTTPVLTHGGNLCAGEGVPANTGVADTSPHNLSARHRKEGASPRLKLRTNQLADTSPHNLSARHNPNARPPLLTLRPHLCALPNSNTRPTPICQHM